MREGKSVPQSEVGSFWLVGSLFGFWWLRRILYSCKNVLVAKEHGMAEGEDEGARREQGRTVREYGGAEAYMKLVAWEV